MDAEEEVDTEEILMSQLGNVRAGGGGAGSPVFTRALSSRAGYPLLVALGALLLAGCADKPLPEYAYTTVGTHWKCERGFKSVEGGCQALELPEHAFLIRSGDDWTCDRGFKRVGEECQSVALPEHAFLSRNGDSWRCNRGYERSNDKCRPVGESDADLPEHAYIDFGRDWKCVRGFERINDECRALEIPEHAFLNYNADDWSCERGYKRVGNKCRYVEVPQHAYLDFRGDDWACDRGLRREGNGCLPE